MAGGIRKYLRDHNLLPPGAVDMLARIFTHYYDRCTAAELLADPYFEGVRYILREGEGTRGWE